MKKSPIMFLAALGMFLIVFFGKTEPRKQPYKNTDTEFSSELTSPLNDGINAQSQMGKLLRAFLQ